MGDAMSESLKRFVFCEGLDDVAVVKGLADSLGMTDLRIEPYKGKDNLGNFLEALSKRPEFAQNEVSGMAVIRDADDNESTAFASVRNYLLTNGFEPCPEQNGSFAGTAMRIGIFIVGPPNKEGTIEDLCMASVRDQPEFSCVAEYFHCITKKSGRSKFSSKARVRVWMASQVNYELYVGEAAREGYWPWANSAFDSLRDFLRALYGRATN
jgi:hypothetical protein